MSLRARLLTVVVSLTAAGLIVAGIATYASLRSFLVDRVDRTVTGGADAIERSLERGRPRGPGSFDALGAANPGIYIGSIDASDVIRWAPIGTRPGETPLPQPDLSTESAKGAAAGGEPFTVSAASGDTRFRVVLEPLRDSGQILIVAAPLDEVDDTLHQLLLVEIVVAGSVLLATLLGGLWLVRVGLRPLGRIEVTAAAIAGGDLSQRVDNDDPRTEVGRLGGALNTMLVQIEEAFDERTESEQRLRRFVADASHELRTPLAAVRAYAELFDRGARERPDDLERAMTGIQRESRRMGLLVDDLLLLARLDQGRPLERKSVALVDVASEAVEAARLLDPDRDLVLEAPSPVEVEGDSERLRQILDNLLANVRAHTPSGTPGTVRVVYEGDLAVVEVIDAGPGLSDDQLAHAFERFYRGDASRSRDAGGAGLGLAIAAAIAESHGGTASVENVGRDGGAGLTVRITLPSPNSW
ncbi:ATP-binding protein [Gaiella sp.]|uniref:sensor histidine kinase n=1 Tax=Gaiella sp. TaxID=2663207 RepID=UPI003266D036